MTDTAGPTVVELVAGDTRLTVCPEVGGAIAGLTWRDAPILRPTPGVAIAERNVRRMASYPLVPYSNRIGYAKLDFQRQAFELRPNFPPEPHAIHGVGWQRAWQVAAHAGNELELTLRHAPDQDWPFAFDAQQVFSLAEGQLTVRLAITNRDTRDTPAGLGFHPFFPLAQGVRLQTTWDGCWESGEDKLPTRWIPLPPEADFRASRAVGDWTVDRRFTHWSREAHLDYPTHRTTLRASALLTHMVCYVPGGHDFIALEPVSHVVVSDSVPGTETDTTLRVLRPGESLAGSMTLTISARQ